MTDQDPDTAHSRKPNPRTPSAADPISNIESTPHRDATEAAFGSLKEMHAYMRLARELD